jgi:uncharacterized protein (TIGR03118 family)
VVRISRFLGRSAVFIVGVAPVFAACTDNSVTNSVTPTSAFVETKLVSDVPSLGGMFSDAQLVNPWGLAFGSTGVLWVSDNGTGVSTLYDSSGAKKSLVVTTPASGGGTGAPTGTIFNATTDFVIPGGTAALFIFAGEDGTITAWSSGATASLVVDRSATGAVYKGIAMASSAGANFLYLTNFRNSTVDVFDHAFQFVKSVSDPNIPAGYAPFGIQNIGGRLFVSFAKQLGPDNMDDAPGVGNGYVDIFNADGTVASRFASNGKLNSPWGIAMAPSSFGSLSGDILIGNFGDGLIGAYDPTSGNFVDFVRDSTQTPIAIDGLWAFTFGVGSQTTTLYFSSGPNGETHGLLGTLTLK